MKNLIEMKDIRKVFHADDEETLHKLRQDEEQRLEEQISQARVRRTAAYADSTDNA